LNLIINANASSAEIFTDRKKNLLICKEIHFVK
jgi:hypothetical protein